MIDRRLFMTAVGSVPFIGIQPKAEYLHCKVIDYTGPTHSWCGFDIRITRRILKTNIIDPLYVKTAYVYPDGSLLFSYYTGDGDDFDSWSFHWLKDWEVEEFDGYGNLIKVLTKQDYIKSKDGQNEKLHSLSDRRGNRRRGKTICPSNGSQLRRS